MTSAQRQIDGSAEMRAGGKEHDANDHLMIHANPMLAGTRFHTPALPDDDFSLPSNVVFLATGGGIRTSGTRSEAAAMPSSLDGWAAFHHKWA